MSKKGNKLASFGATFTLFVLYRTTKKMVRNYSGGGKKTISLPKRNYYGFDSFKALRFFRR